MLHSRYYGVALAALVTLGLNATPASAAAVSAESSVAALRASCTVSTINWECTTGTVSANSSTHQVWFRVAPVIEPICGPGGVDYRLWDIDSGVTIRSGTMHWAHSETIGGLYGRYRLRLKGTCYSEGFLRNYTP